MDGGSAESEFKADVAAGIFCRRLFSNICYVNCSFDINGKRNKIRVDTSGRGHVLYIETEGRRVIDKAQEFVNLLNGLGAAYGRDD